MDSRRRVQLPVREIAVFLGPSLRRAAARSLLDADYYPPAQKGDVYRILASGVRTIVLIDGASRDRPAIWQRELLDAMREGIRVVGASTMGALRAAELHLLGMEGRGTVFEWLRDGVIDGDDEVEGPHRPGGLAWSSLSETMVNIRYNLRRAVDRHRLDAVQAGDLIEYAKQLPHLDRSFRLLLRSPVVAGWKRPAIARLRRYLATNRVDLHESDTRAALRHCARLGQRPPRPMRTDALAGPEESWWARERQLMTGFVGRRIVTGGEVLAMAREVGGLTDAMRRPLSRLRFLLEWSRENEVACPVRFRARFHEQWEKKYSRGDRADWTAANGLTPTAYGNLVADRALADWLTSKGPKHFGLTTGFVADWARHHGIARPKDASHGGSRAGAAEKTEEAEAWIVARGPGHFGIRWSYDAALLQELQVTGRAAELVAALEAR